RRWILQIARRCCGLFPAPEIGLHKSAYLIKRDVAYDGDDDLTGYVFSAVETDDIRVSNLVERLFGAVQRPAVGMPMEHQLVKGLHGDMPGIVVVAGHLPEDLRAYSLELGFVKGRMLKDVSQQRKSQLGIFFQDADGSIREIFGCPYFQCAADKVDLFGELFGRPSSRAFVERTGDEIGRPGLFRRVLC